MGFYFIIIFDSELVDKVYGQLRSHITCPNCKRESVTFDPFNCLSLPVPVKSTKTIGVVVHLLPHGSPPRRVDVDVEITDSVGGVSSILVLPFFLTFFYWIGG